MKLPDDPKKLKQHLVALTTSVTEALGYFDEVMNEPESVLRGKKIANICNWLEIQNDSARYFGLGIDYRTDKKPQRKENR